MIKVVAFDLDDTLWESYPVLIRAEKCVHDWLKHQVPALAYDVIEMRELRFDILKESPELAHYITELRRRVIERAMVLSGVDTHTARSLSTEAMEVFLEARNRIDMPRETLATLATLSERFTLGSITNGNADIERLGLSRYFSFALCAEEIGAAKPATDLFRAALAHTDTRPREMVYVGDDPLLDIDPAKSIGIYAVQMANPRRQTAGRMRPDATISRIDELPAAIERLDRGRR